MQSSLSAGDGETGDDGHQCKKGGKDGQRCTAIWLDRDQRRKNKEQARRGQNRVFRHALERSPGPLRNHRHEKEKKNEKRQTSKDARPCSDVGTDQPHRKNEEGRTGAKEVQLLRPTPDRNSCEACHDKEQETEEQSPSSTKLGNQGQIGGKEHGQHRCGHSDLFESPIELGVVPAGENQPGERDHREDQEDRERGSNIGGIEEPQHPHPLVDGGERHTQGRQKRPAFAISDPAETGVEDDEVAEER